MNGARDPRWDTEEINELRADIGQRMVELGATDTNVIRADDVYTCVKDTLSYVAHFCDRMGFDAHDTFGVALDSYAGDSEDGPDVSEYRWVRRGLRTGEIER